MSSLEDLRSFHAEKLGDPPRTGAARDVVVAERLVREACICCHEPDEVGEERGDMGTGEEDGEDGGELRGEREEVEVVELPPVRICEPLRISCDAQSMGMIIDFLDHSGGFCLLVGDRGASLGETVISAGFDFGLRGVGGATFLFFFSFLPLRGFESSDESSFEEELSSPSPFPFSDLLTA